MASFFKIDSKFYQGLTRLADLMLLNALILLCSLPLVTMGSAWCAAFVVLHQGINVGKSLSLRYLKAFRAVITTSSLWSLVWLLWTLSLVCIFYWLPWQFLQFFILLTVAFSYVVYLVGLLRLAGGQRLSWTFFETIMGLSLKYLGIFCFGASGLLVTWLIPLFLPKLTLLWLAFGLSLPLAGLHWLYGKACHFLHLTTTFVEEEIG